MTLLTPEALDAFLVEKLEARRALVELDLEPSGLVIKHDDDGELERVEPAVAEKVGGAAIHVCVCVCVLSSHALWQTVPRNKVRRVLHTRHTFCSACRVSTTYYFVCRRYR